MLGGPKELPQREVERLVDLSREMNIPGKHPCVDGNSGCCGTAPTAAPANDQASLIERITKEVMAQLSK